MAEIGAAGLAEIWRVEGIRLGLVRLAADGILDDSVLRANAARATFGLAILPIRDAISATTHVTDVLVGQDACLYRWREMEEMLYSRGFSKLRDTVVCRHYAKPEDQPHQNQLADG